MRQFKIYWSYFTALDEITDVYPETIDDDFDKELSIARRYRDLVVIYMKISDYKKAPEKEP